MQAEKTGKCMVCAAPIYSWDMTCEKHSKHPIMSLVSLRQDAHDAKGDDLGTVLANVIDWMIERELAAIKKATGEGI